MGNTNNLKADLSAGFSVALVALPLSIGIALASGAPASAGLIAAIIGGLVGSWLGGSHVTINGPAAGLIVIVLDAITMLGNGDTMQGFRGMLAASVVAGALQIVFGALKLGRKGTAFPVSVIHGMMAAIGLIIIAKQAHLVLGNAPEAKNPLMLFAELPHAFATLDQHLQIAFVGFVSLAFIFNWSKLTAPWTKKLPPPLLTVILGSGIAMLIGLTGKGLLQVPADVRSWIIFPDFSVMSTFMGWKFALTLALVGSLETVLSAAAIDKLDPLKRTSNLDRDLLSKGVCNIASAAIGGIPMIAEIVRSSANVTYGARTWKANFIHGLIILIAVLVLPSALALIPVASLAAVLLMVGSRLGNPMHLIHAKKIGLDNFAGFATTLFITLSVDLLVGILAGAIIQYIVEISLGLKIKNIFKASFKEEVKTREAIIYVDSALIFSNFLDIKEKISQLAATGMSIKLELASSDYIDHSVIEQLHELETHYKEKGISFEIHYSKNHKPMGDDADSSLKKVA